MMTEEIPNAYFTASYHSSDGTIWKSLLIQFNKLTTFKTGKFFALCYQNVLKVWLPDSL